MTAICTAFLHLMFVLMVIFCTISYIVCGYVTFFHNDPVVRKGTLNLKLLFWLISPVIVLDILLEKIFGWSFMS